jgi:hypothetical protein
VKLSGFEALVRRLAAEIPADFLGGVAEITVSPRVVPHPDRPDIFTLGECVPLPTALDDPAALQSRIVLYYGSFAALARDDEDFDWEGEAWETLTHEIRHHVEWRARADDLEDEDAATEENYARQASEPFDPLFYRDGERLPNGVFRVEDDYFIELGTVAPGQREIRFEWAGGRYRVELPRDLHPPAFLTVNGLELEPAESVVLVVLPLRRRLGLLGGVTDQREVNAVSEGRGTG